MPRSAPRPPDTLVPFEPDPALFRNLPDRPGVYRFHGEADELLYVGKSVRIRERVQSHWAARYRDHREYRLCWLTRRITFTETAGELGALLRENAEIKSGLPVFNRKQRRPRHLYTWFLHARSDGVLHPVLSHPLGTQPNWLQTGFGLYSSPARARKHLEHLASEHALCRKVLGLERGPGPCFARQLRRCQGACCGQESLAEHNHRLEEVLYSERIRAWPLDGPMVIADPDEQTPGCDYHLVDQWRYLGTAATENEARALITDPPDTPFDLDAYRILLPRVMAELDAREHA
jgi:DNA polymerase-3 subunit epsilon